MKRRHFVAAAAASALASPAIGQGTARVLRFVPEGNLANPDPIWTTTTVARNHGLMIFDTLYSLDATYTPRPQMAAGHEVSADGLTWRFALRDGLMFHDGEPVRASDCVASIQRWAKRKPLGQTLLARADEMRATGDKTFEIRLKKPFALMTATLADWCFIMPERIARTDPFQQISEFTGSGPFRFVRDEWVSGSQAIYTRFDGYKPRDEKPSFAGGGKAANVDRVEWRVIPDFSTAVAALQRGEVDWIQQPTFDLLPVLRRSPGVTVAINDKVGVVGMLGINHLFPPFNNPALLRAILSAIDQDEYMAAALGSEADLFHVPSGVFTPGLPMATDAGLEAVTSPRDLARSKKLVAESGYAGEKVTLLAPSDYPVQFAFAQVTVDLFKRLGIAVDMVTTDWGTLVSRRASREPPDKGGWNIFPTTYEGLTVANPATHVPMRGNGLGGWFGWPTSPRLEALRDQWIDAPDTPAQQRICADMQRVAFEEVPFIPLGQLFYATAFRTTLRDIVPAPFPVFWGLSKASA